MVQNLILILLVLLCVLLIISLLRKPFDAPSKNPCKFKILCPKFVIDGKHKQATFDIIVEKRHRYFINFPLSFKFYSEQKFKSAVKVYYLNLEEKTNQLLLDRYIEFNNKSKEHIVYITDVIIGKIVIDIIMDVEFGNPIIGFEILENSTCELTKEHKMEIKFPD